MVLRMFKNLLIEADAITLVDLFQGKIGNDLMRTILFRSFANANNSTGGEFSS